MIDLNRRIDKWVVQGIITGEQAELMRGSLTGESPPREAAEEPETRVPIVTEILGYVGAALAIWAVMFLVSEFWANLSEWAQAALFGALAIALFAGGAALLDSREAALERLSGVLWAGSVLALGGALFIVLNPMVELSAELTWTLIGVAGTAVAAPMLWRQRSAMQHIVLFAVVLTTVVSLIALGPEVELFVFGFAVWSIGLIWALVSRAGVLNPSDPGMVLGVASMFVGAQIAAGSGDSETFGVLLGVATAALLATAGVMLREKLSIVLGGVGIFMFVPQAMFLFFGETFGGMFGVFVSGLALVGLAVWFGRHKEAL